MNIINPPEIVAELTRLNPFDRLPDGRPCVPDDLLERMKTVTSEQAWAILDKEGYLFQFARLTGDEIYKPSEIGRVHRQVRDWYSCQIGMQGVCWRREGAGKRFTFQSMSLAV